MLLPMALTHFGDRDVLFVRMAASCRNSSACVVASKDAAKIFREKYISILH